MIQSELGKMGLRLNEAKSKISKSTDGFDFLGWHFYVQANNGKFRCIPSKDSYRKIRKKIKEIVNCSNLSTVEKANKLSSIVRGWRNYHKYCNMKNHSLWHTQYATWKKFRRDKNSNREKAKSLTEKAFPAVPYSENRHVKVQGGRSPYDGDILYWSERNSKLYDGRTAKLLKKQDFECGHCNMKMQGDERIHLHHKDGNHGNWKDKNLTVIHESCHDYIHMGKSAS